MNQYQYNLGIEAYKNGEKIPRWPTREFVDGWWYAHDSGEKFGEYDSFLEAD